MYLKSRLDFEIPTSYKKLDFEIPTSYKKLDLKSRPVMKTGF